MRFPVLMALPFLFWSPAIAAEDCSPVNLLIQDNNVTINDETTKLSILDQVDKEHFEQAKKSFQGGASIVVDGLPISGYSNFEDFKSALDREKRLYRFDLDQRKSSIVAQQSLSDNALQAYVACLSANRDTGVIVWVGNTGAFSKKAIVNIKWLGGVGGKEGQLENQVVIDGADVSDALLKTIPTTWRDKETVSLILTRHPTEDALVLAKVSGYSGTLVIPRDPPVPIVTETSVTTDEIHLKTDRDDFQQEQCVNAGQDEFFVLSPTPKPALRYIGDAPHNQASASTLTPKRVCVTAKVSTAATGTTEELWASLTVIKRRVTFQ